MPFIGLISLIFIVPIIIALIWIFVLQRKKADAPEDYVQHYDYHDDKHFDNTGYGQDYYDDGYSQNQAMKQPHSRSDAAQHGSYDGYNDYYHHAEVDRYPPRRSQSHLGPQQHAPPPRPPRPPEHAPIEDWQQRQRAPPRARPRPQHETYQDTVEEKATTVPCKCGEIIIVTDSTRPLRIKCPRCGRRGILEGKQKAPEDDIFY
jgi:hypothetical protein